MEKNYDTTSRIGPKASQTVHGPRLDTAQGAQADDTRPGATHRCHLTVATCAAARWRAYQRHGGDRIHVPSSPWARRRREEGVGHGVQVGVSPRRQGSVNVAMAGGATVILDGGGGSVVGGGGW
jgi:hypothetical protein